MFVSLLYVCISVCLYLFISVCFLLIISICLILFVLTFFSQTLRSNVFLSICFMVTISFHFFDSHSIISICYYLYLLISIFIFVLIPCPLTSHMFLPSSIISQLPCFYYNCSSFMSLCPIFIYVQYSITSFIVHGSHKQTSFIKFYKYRDRDI